MIGRRHLAGALAVAAGVAALATVLLVRDHVADVAARVGPTAPVLHLREAARAHRPIPSDAVVVRDLPSRWTPPGAVTRAADLAGLVPAADLPAGTLLQRGALVPRSTLLPGEREVVVLVDGATAGGGRLRPGDRVDVFATFPADAAGPASTRLLLQDAAIAAVGGDPSAGSVAGGALLPVRFSLSVADSQALVHAEAFATSIRLAGRSPDDRGRTTPVTVTSATLGGAP